MTIISHLDRRQKKAMQDRFKICRATLYNVAKNPKSNVELFNVILTQVEENKKMIERAAQLQKAAELERINY